MNMYTFEIVKPTDAIWAQINTAAGQNIFHTKEWFSYQHLYSRQKPFLASITRKDTQIGFFVGNSKWGGGGKKTIYSPLINTGAYTQGIVALVSLTHTERINIYTELAQWLFTQNIAKCLKVDDYALRKDVPVYIPEIEYEDLSLMGIEHIGRPTFNIDLTIPEEELWHNLHYKSCRYCINKAKKEELYVHQITDKQEIAQFITTHHQQICDVSKRKREETRRYQQEQKLFKLCNILFPNKVLMLQVRGKDENGQEQIMASGIWLIGKTESVWWTGASFQRYQHYCPNELMVWEAMRILKAKGSENLNLCGIAGYKRKFGSTMTYVPRLYFRKHKYIILWDELLKKVYHKFRYIKHITTH